MFRTVPLLFTFLLFFPLFPFFVVFVTLLLFVFLFVGVQTCICKNETELLYRNERNKIFQSTYPSTTSLVASYRLYACAFYVCFYAFLWAPYLSNDNVQVMVPDAIGSRTIAHWSEALVLCQRLVVSRLCCVTNCCPVKRFNSTILKPVRNRALVAY